MAHTVPEHSVVPAAGWDDGVLASLYEVAFSARDREVAGVLVGTPATANAQPQVHAVIPAAEGFVPGQAAQFTHETWAHVHRAMADHYRGLDIIGWYVSRPGTGTGLRDVQRTNHRTWFSRGRQILLVLDSRSYRGALYVCAHEGGELVAAHEGPVARRYTRHADPPGRPLAALAMLMCLGVLLGAVAFVIVEAATAL